MLHSALFAEAVVELADSLAAGFDVDDHVAVLASRCVEVFGVAGAGIVLSDHDGTLGATASSTTAIRTLERFDLNGQRSPSLDCFRTGAAVAGAGLMASDPRWPLFARAARSAGFHAVDVIPMVRQDEMIGVLSLFHTTPSSMTTDDVMAAGVLAGVATLAILQHDAAVSGRVLNGQLSRALQSRVVIEQAKGMVAVRLGIGLDGAFDVLRDHARKNNRLLADVAADVTERRALVLAAKS